MSLEKRYKMIGWLFILPAAAILVFTKFYPMIQALLLSFKGGNPLNMKFTGISNYARLFQDDLFKTAMFNTAFYLIQVPIMLLLALMLATMLNSKTLKFRGVFRTAIFLPCITAAVSYSMVFRAFFTRGGLVDSMLMQAGFISDYIPWLDSAWLARCVIVLAMTWRWTGYNTIFYLAGLQNIDGSVYEAAKIDGASHVQSFFRITIPLLRPIILLTTITSVNGTLQLFAETKNITNNGPGNATLTLSNYIYKLSFEYTPQFGYAAAISYVVFFLVAVLALFQMKVGDKR